MYSDSSHLEQKVLHTVLGNWNYIVSHKGDRGLLFLHGANSSHRIWHQQMGLTIKGYKRIFVDLLGYGGSDKPATGYHLSVWICPQHKLLLWEDAGHFIPMQFPERLADLIKDVLQ